MNTRFAKIGAVALLVSLAALGAYRASRAQSVEAPPVKMGLWETESSTTMSGMANIPGGGKHTTVTQGCLTPENWKGEFEKIQRADQDCKVTNTQQDAHSLTVDETCSTARYSSTVHMEAHFENAEHMHGTGKATITGQGMPQGMTMDFAIDSHFVSSACGDVKPGSAKIVHH
jgi:Protein of unknown function (DUF3617)